MNTTGTYKKVCLLFDSIFWSTEKPIIGLIREHRQLDNEQKRIDIGNYLLLDNSWATNYGIPVLEAVLVGEPNENMNGQTEEIIRESILDFIYESFLIAPSSKSKPRCIYCHITRWEEDPFTRGAYSHYPLNCSPSYFEDLSKSEWEGSLHFAGEATHPLYQGSLHAAILSADSVAEKVVNQFLYRKKRVTDVTGLKGERTCL